MTDLVSILDELLGNVQEFLEFFRHGDVCGVRKCLEGSKRVRMSSLFPTNSFFPRHPAGPRQAPQGTVFVELAARFIR